MYKSPIKLIDEFAKSVIKQHDENIYKAVLGYGVVVDKGELIKALKYDREQYEKGEWDMFCQISSVCFGKEYYSLEEDGRVYSRLCHRSLPNKGAAYKEFLDYIEREC